MLNRTKKKNASNYLNESICDFTKTLDPIKYATEIHTPNQYCFLKGMTVSIRLGANTTKSLMKQILPLTKNPFIMMAIFYRRFMIYSKKKKYGTKQTGLTEGNIF